MSRIIKLNQNDLTEIVKRALIGNMFVNEQKKEKIEIPQSCFGGPKTGLGGLILFTTILQKEADQGDMNSEKLIADMKTFLKGMNRANPEMIATLLKKYNKNQYMPWVGCF
jgi:hypothetical protein